MAINFDDLQEPSYVEIRRAAKWCLATGNFGVSRTIGGKSLAFNTPKDCMETIKFCDEQLGYEDTSSPLGMVSVQFNDPN